MAKVFVGEFRSTPKDGDDFEMVVPDDVTVDLAPNGLPQFSYVSFASLNMVLFYVTGTRDTVATGG